jgi:DNA-binding XRE family transcriptional regulator
MSRIERLSHLRALTTSGQAEAIRKAAHLRRTDVASAVGVDHTTIGRWERGERLPTGEAALKYAALLDRLAKATAS